MPGAQLCILCPVCRRVQPLDLAPTGRDLRLSSPPTIGLPAYVLSRLWRVPFVYQIQDMWPETLSATGMFNNERLLRWIGRFAMWVYGKAHDILVIAGFLPEPGGKGSAPSEDPRNLELVDPETYYCAEPDETLAQELGLSGRFNVMFAGNMGEAQGLETVIEAAKLLENEVKQQFVLVGDGIALPAAAPARTRSPSHQCAVSGRFPSAGDAPALCSGGWCSWFTSRMTHCSELPFHTRPWPTWDPASQSWLRRLATWLR